MDMTSRDMLGMMTKVGLAGVALGSMSAQAAEAALPPLTEPGAKNLKELMKALDHTPRRASSAMRWPVPLSLLEVVSQPGKWASASWSSTTSRVEIVTIAAKKPSLNVRSTNVLVAPPVLNRQAVVLRSTSA